MKSKRTILLVLTAALLLSSKPVFAQELNSSSNLSTSTSAVVMDKLVIISEKDKAKISQEQAKDKAKKILADYFELNIDETRFRTEVNFSLNDFQGQKKSVWNIHWYNNDEDKQVNVNVSVDGTTGKILSVNKYEFSQKQGSQLLATITEEQAKEIGENFLKRINPEEFKEIKLFKDKNSIQYYGMTNYSFHYNRTIKEIPFEGNYINLGVDGVSGKVTSYEINWDSDLKIPGEEKTIEQKAAEEIFNKNTEMDLSYNNYPGRPNGTEENKTKLVYIQNPTSPFLIDAVSGKELNWNGQSIQTIKSRNITEAQKEQIFKGGKPVVTLDKEISSERATEVINNKLKELCGDGYEIQSINYSDQEYGYMGRGMKIWSASYVKKGESSNYLPAEGQISINALTEELVRIDKFNYNEKVDENFTPQLTWEKAYDKAIEFIAKNCPQRIKEINTEQKDYNNQSYSYPEDYARKYITFNFARTVKGVAFNNNGVPYNNDGINVTLDTKTGEINSFSYMWQDKLELPTAEKVISKDEAKKIFLEDNKPTLTYLLFNGGKVDSNMKLVYSIGNRYSPINAVDAANGKLLNLYGENIDNNLETFKAAVKGTAVEKEALILASQGIIDTKDFKLDSKITRLQLVKILVNAKGYDPYLKGMNELSFSSGIGDKESIDYKYLQFGVRYGIIQDKREEFKGDELVTREEVAASLIKLLGYDKIAEIKGLFNVNYTDKTTIAEDKVGYVTLAGGLKLLEGSGDGKFRPKDTVTMSEIVKAVYTALGNIQK